MWPLVLCLAHDTGPVSLSLDTEGIIPHHHQAGHLGVKLCKVLVCVLWESLYPGGTTVHNVLLGSESRSSPCAQERATRVLGDLTVHAQVVCSAGRCILSPRGPAFDGAGGAPLS